LNGFEIDTINTVQKCTHNRYQHFTGTELSIEDFKNIVGGLRENGLLYSYSYIMTGYIRSAELLKLVADLVREIKDFQSKQSLTNANLIYLCDPVMGDIYPEIADTHKRGVMYVPKDILPVYRNEILPLADILTPNQCELELLLNGEFQIENDADMKKALTHEIFKDKQIFVTSNLEINSPEIVGYCKLGSFEKFKIYKFSNDRMPACFVGTGDLFSATLLAEVHHNLRPYEEQVLDRQTNGHNGMTNGTKSNDISPVRSRSNSEVFADVDFTNNVKNVLWTMYSVVNTTFKYSETFSQKSYEHLELQLVRCKREIDMSTRAVSKDFKIEEI